MVLEVNNSTGLYISNDGSISTSQTRAINLLGSTNAEIINNTSGIISSETIRLPLVVVQSQEQL